MQFLKRPRKNPAKTSYKVSDREYPVDLAAELLALERDFIEEALRRSNGIKNRAAKLLNLFRPTLLEKMRRQGMPLNKPKGNFYGKKRTQKDF